MTRLFVIAAVLATTACAPRFDAPWDPPAGHVLFDQDFAPDGYSVQVCCQHLDTVQAIIVGCNTSQPTAPRSSRC